MVECRTGREIHMSPDRATGYLRKRLQQYLEEKRAISSVRLAEQVYRRVHYRKLVTASSTDTILAVRIPCLREIEAKYTNPHQ